MATITKNLDGVLYDFTQNKNAEDPVVEFKDGHQQVTGFTPLKFSTIAIRACMTDFAGDNNMPGEERLKNFQLGVKVSRGGDIDFTPEEIERLKKRVLKFPNTMIAGQLAALLVA